MAKLELLQWHDCSIFINKSEQIEYLLPIFISFGLNRKTFIDENLMFDH